MRETEEPVLLVSRCWQGGEQPPADCRELAHWARRQAVAPGEGQVLLAGRLCGEMRTGEWLHDGAGGSLRVIGLFAYGHGFDSLGAGMTAGVLAEPAGGSRREWTGELLRRRAEEENCGPLPHIY